MTTPIQKPLSGRVALITGASRKAGIGYAIARRLAAQGVNLFLQGYSAYDAAQYDDENDMGALADSLRSRYGVRVGHVSTNFDIPNAPDLVMRAACERYEHVDILIANHAYSTTGDLEALSAEAIDMHLHVNVRATLLLVQAFAAQHDGRPGGRVLLMTSGQNESPMPGELAYIASKGALYSLTGSLSAHLMPRGITVNAVNPGATDTGYADSRLRAWVLERSPQGRWGQPDDAARLVTWLVSDEALWITGQVISSTGGGP